MKAAYISLGAGGHILSSLPLIGSLVRRGVEVDYYAPESFRSQVELTGARLCPFPEVTECYSNPYMAKEPFLAVIPLVFLGQAKEALDAVMDGLRQNRPDVILSDALALAGRLAASRFQLPLVLMFTSYAPSAAFSIYRTWPSFTDSPARLKALQVAEVFQQEYGGKLLTPEEIFEGTGDLNLCALSSLLQPCPDSFDERFYFAGAQIAPRAGEDLWQPPSNGKPLLYTSLGSLFNHWPDFYRMLFPAVENLDINVVCAVGKTIRPEMFGSIPSNVKLLPFAPQLRILEKADFFITHAGTGSAMEAMYFGVPCLCLPQMEEQILTAERMVQLGCAVGMLERQQVTEDTLRECILQLISDDQCRQNAERIRSQLRLEGGCEGAADAVIDFMHKQV